LYDQAVNWYGEISTSGGPLNWGSTALGSGFADGINEKNSISATYISNGNYNEQVESAGTWAGSPSGTATFDATGACTSTNSFSLRAWRDTTFASAVQVTTTGANLSTSAL